MEVKTDMARHTHKASEHHLTLDLVTKSRLRLMVFRLVFPSQQTYKCHKTREKNPSKYKKRNCVCFIAYL